MINKQRRHGLKLTTFLSCVLCSLVYKRIISHALSLTRPRLSSLGGDFSEKDVV